MAPGCVYKGHIAKVSPPDVALAIAPVSGVSVPVLIFLNNLYKDCDLGELSNSEWIQDHLRADDVVEFEIEKRQRRSAHRNYNVAIFAWKIDWNTRQSNRRCCSKAKRCSSGDVDQVASSAVSHVGTSDVESCTVTTAQTGIKVEFDTDKSRFAFMCEASEPASDSHLPLHGASEHVSPSEDADFADNSQESKVKTVASDLREYPGHDVAHTVAHKLVPHSPGKSEHHGGVGPSDIPERVIGVGPSDIPERDVGEMCERQRTCRPHCGTYSGRIYSFGHNHGTIAFTMDGREERALFYSLKVYINGIKTRKKCNIRNILQSGMLVTLDVMQYEGDTFKYKATRVYIEGSQVAGRLTGSSGEEAASNGSRTSCHKSLEKMESPVDQVTAEEEMYRRQVTHRHCWDSLSVSHTRDCICRTCPVADTESREDLAKGVLAFPRQEASVATGRQETVGSAHLSEEEPTAVLPSSKIVLDSEVTMSAPHDDQEEDKVPESCAEIDCFVSETQKTAELNSSVQEDCTNGTPNASHCIVPLDLLPESARNVPGVIDASWSSSMVLMTATVCKLKARVLISGRDLYVDKKYIVLNADWQRRAHGMKVCADVSVMRDHPSGAVYVATCAWKGKRPRNVEQRRTRESNSGTCPKNRAGNNANSSMARSELDLQRKGSVDGRRTSESCDAVNVKYPAKDKGTNDKKFMYVDKSCCVQRGVETDEGEMCKTLRSEEFVSTVRGGAEGFERGAQTDGNKCEGVDISDLLDEVKPLCRDEATGDARASDSSGRDKIVQLPVAPVPHTGQTDSNKCRGVDISDLLDEVKPSCRDEAAGDARASDSSGRDKIVQLPVVPVPHTGLANQMRRKLARVKRYESSTRGVLEYAICGAELEVIFHKSVVNFCGSSDTTDLEEYLPVGSEVYFEGEMLGENKLLGCSDIIVTSVQETRAQRKQVSSKRANFRTFRLVSPAHEGLLQGRVYEGVVSQIRPPFAFVAVVEDGGKTYDVFVLNRFFSPAEYGARLPAKHPVMPYIAEGTKLHVMVGRRNAATSKLTYTHEWFAVDAWTEEQNDTFPVTDTERNEDHLEGVIMRVFPAWGLLQVDHLTDAVMFFRQDTFLFGVRLAAMDLEQVLPVGKSHSVSANLRWIRARSRLVPLYPYWFVCQ
jgi:hypothetical protein